MKEDLLKDLVDIVAKLRSPNGCPWDKEQTHESIIPGLIEESAELIDAIEAKDDENMIEELGDVMLQVIFHSQIATEQGRFTIEDVMKHVCNKLVSRHPHVFTDENNIKEANAAYLQWEEIKKKEKNNESRKSSLSGVPNHLPALQKAEKTLKKAAKVGFRWENQQQALEKVEEELEELKTAFINNNEEEIEEEIGDLLFSIVGVTTLKELYAEKILKDAIKKFTQRFNDLEESLNNKNTKISDCSTEELKKHWNENKKKTKK